MPTYNSETGTLKFPAIKVRQNGHDLYMVDLTAADLLAHTKVDKWMSTTTGQAPENQGYQREELQSHYNKVGRYLVNDKKAILPTSILLSVRGPVTFEPLDRDSTMGFLVITEGSLPLYIVDGQHRVAGLRHAIEDLHNEGACNFTLPAVIMAGLPKFDEVQQFYLVNSTSKRIKTDLAERLLTEMAEQDDDVRATVISKGKAYLLRAVKVVEMLNDRAGSPWEGRIQSVNGRKIGEVMITESSFNESLKPILGISWVTKQTDLALAEMINRYWMAIRHYMPNAFETPRNYSVQKTIGTYVWHMVAPAILEVCRTDNDFTVENMVNVLKPTAGEFLAEDYWEVGTGGASQYSSRGAFAVLAESILDELPETDAVMI